MRRMAPSGSWRMTPTTCLTGDLILGNRRPCILERSESRLSGRPTSMDVGRQAGAIDRFTCPNRLGTLPGASPKGPGPAPPTPARRPARLDQEPGGSSALLLYWGSCRRRRFGVLALAGDSRATASGLFTPKRLDGPGPQATPQGAPARSHWW